MTDSGKWAEALLDAERARRAIEPLTDSEPGLTIDDAYAIQAELLARKVADGERIVGAKLGLASRAEQEAIGVHEPLCAWLTDAMIQPADEPLTVDELIHPRVEPEVVFVLGDNLEGPGVTVPDVLDATRAVCCGLEVIDSRFTDFRITLPDVVADNAGAARFVLGPRMAAPRDLDLALVGCLLEDRGEVVATAAGAAVQGHPAEAVALLANFLGGCGQRLEEGWIVLSGGLTAPVTLAGGSHVAATFGHLGRVGLRTG